MIVPVVVFGWILLIMSFAVTIRELSGKEPGERLDVGISPLIGAVYGIVFIIIFLRKVAEKEKR